MIGGPVCSSPLNADSPSLHGLNLDSCVSSDSKFFGRPGSNSRYPTKPYDSKPKRNTYDFNGSLQNMNIWKAIKR